MAIYLQSTSTVANLGIKVLVYGPAGVGKTRLIATAPGPVILSAEGGLLSLRQYNLPYIEIHTLAQMSEAYQWLLYSHEARQFPTVAVDSASEIAETILKNEKGLTRDPRKAYGELIDKMIPMVKDFRDLPGRNVIITAKQEFAKDESTGMMIWAPSMPGQKVGPALPYLFDEVFQYCIFQNPQTRQAIEALRTRRDYQNEAKDRSGALNEFEEPNLTKIFAKIAAAPPVIQGYRQ